MYRHSTGTLQCTLDTVKDHDLVYTVDCVCVCVCVRTHAHAHMSACPTHVQSISGCLSHERPMENQLDD